jgi:hemin uptake protein HemP
MAIGMSLNDEPQAERPTGNHTEPTSGETPVVAFESMASGQREVVIEYRGQQYRLRATRNGKLILNK